MSTKVVVRFSLIGSRKPVDLSFTTPATGEDVQRAVASAVFDHIHTRGYVAMAPRVEARDQQKGLILSGGNTVGTFSWTETTVSG